MTVFIVVRKGPEWTDILDVYDTFGAAIKAAEAKTRENSASTDVMEKLSSYAVVVKIVKS